MSFSEDRYFRADGFIIRTKITVRADGFLSVQGLVTLPRANRIYCTDDAYPYNKYGF